MSQKTVHEFVTHDCLSPPDNRIHTLDTLRELIESIRVNGQQVPGVVTDHPTERAKYLVVMGNGRKEACKYLGIKFQAILLDRMLSEAELVKLRLTENLIRSSLTPLEVINDILLYRKATGCTQKEAAAQLGIDQSTISRYMTTRRLPPELREQVDSGVIDPTSGYYIATLGSPEQMREAAKKVIDGKLTKDAVIALTSAMKGKKQQKQPKKTRVTLLYDLPPTGAAAALIEYLKSTITKINKFGDEPPEKLVALLK